MKKIALLLLCTVLLVGCANNAQAPTQKKYTATFLELFNTMTTVVGMADSEEQFQALVTPIRDELDRYHKLFDIYEDYEGINNLKTVNDNAGKSAVTVDTAILDMLEDAKEYYVATDGRFNPALGSVLALWHEAREDGLDDPTNAYLPDSEALKEAAAHTDPDNIIIDRENSTVYLSDGELRLDVGAIAKGFAVQRVCENAPDGLLISVGGNVYATGPKSADGTPWSVGIKNPSEESDYYHTLNIKSGTVVTSGIYERKYFVDGKLYHHIIDPETLYPGERWISVTVVTEDSGLADVLSTALFLLDLEQGRALADRFGAHAMWVGTDGKKHYSSEFKQLIRN